MPFHYRRRIRLGPIYLNFTEHGFSSWSVKIGPWSWNSRQRRSRIDLPGGASWVERRRG